MSFVHIMAWLRPHMIRINADADDSTLASKRSEMIGFRLSQAQGGPDQSQNSLQVCC